MTLDVRLAGVSVGTVASEHGQTSLTYADTHLASARPSQLSLSLPLRRGPQPAGHWLDGLLPDNIAVRRKWAARHNAKDASPMSLLATPIGLDCAGAVQFAPRSDGWPSARDSGVAWADENDIAEWLTRIRDDWDDWDGPRGAGRFSLGGAQAKCAVRRDGQRWGIPYGDTATTHILKPGVMSLPDADVVEHLCMETARLLGMDTARTALVRFAGQRTLVVERYDRHGSDARRLHQEDLCQSLGFPPALKYQSLGGPSPAQIADHLRSHSAAGDDDVRQFAEAVAFNWLIGAPDAHAKNYSVLLDRGVWLAPLYDVISFVPYTTRPISEHMMAMGINADTAFGDADNAAYWTRFADAVSLPPATLLDRIGSMIQQTPAALRVVAAALPEPDRSLRAVADLQDGITRRCQTLASHIPPPADRQPDSRSAPGGNSPLEAVACQHEHDGRICNRRLLTRPCPLHPHSRGSRQILSRDT